MLKIIKKIESSKTFIIAGHINPDGDCVGSMLALAEFLMNKGKEVTLFCPNKIPEFYRFLKFSERIKYTLDAKKKYDVFISLDTGSLDRLGAAEKKIKQCGYVINIDHHVSNTLFGNLNYVKEKSAAVGEMLFDFFKKQKISITPSMAQSLYVSIATDTGYFQYSSVTAKTFKIAAQIIGYGVNVSEVSQKLQCFRTLNSYKLLGMVLGSIEVDEAAGIGSMIVTQEMFKKTNTSFEDTEEFINYLRSIKGVKVALFFKEKEDKNVKVSVRSLEDFDSNKFSLKFGGGGHVRASGFNYDGDIGVCRREVVKECKKEMLNF